MILMDLYQKGKGVIKKFDAVETQQQAEDFVKSYCTEHNLHVVAREYCGNAHWNYLSDGTEIDYCSE